MCERLSPLLGYEIQPPLELCDGVITAGDTAVSIGGLWDVYRSAVDTGEDVRWPLAPLVTAWQQRPRPVEPNRRLTDRVIPAPTSHGQHRCQPAAAVQPGGAH